MGAVVILAAIVANLVAASGDFTRAKFATETAGEVGVPLTWLPVLGTLKVAGATGLTLGLMGVPYLGLAAATGLVLFFLGAIAVHLRVHEFHHVVATVGYLALAIAALSAELV
ncbi:DoxX family protein [Actinoplanes sp. NPDC048791]|uniref:DoxX family protein n=1 Tax=Actinoplanes sp. NPDC048791 TaxID=3154623 RepID=UPI0034015D88